VRTQLRNRTAAVAMFAAAAALLAPGTAFGGPWGADYFPNVPLVTQDGKVVRFYDDLLKGKSVAVNLIYTHCSASCPLETAKMTQVQRILGDRVGKDIFFYSISIDPKNDTPEVMKAYMQKYHIGPGWLFLTGKEEDIKLISGKLGLSSLTDLSNRDGHMPSLMIGNEPSGRWMRNSAVDNPRFLARTIGNFLGWKSTEPMQSYADLREPPKIDEGARLFKNRCAACHTVVANGERSAWIDGDNRTVVSSAIPKQYGRMLSTVVGLRLDGCTGPENQNRKNDRGCKCTPAHK